MTESNTGPINDRSLIDQAKEASEYLHDKYAKERGKATDKKFLDGSKLIFPFPLDRNTIDTLRNLLFDKKTPDSKIVKNNAGTSTGTEDEPEIPYSKADDLSDLWITLIEKSIQCLRFFDTRESFQDNPNTPIGAYGIDSLKEYQEHYTNFESMLYGSSTHYRDHVFHSFRVWLLGVYVLTIAKKNERLIDKLVLDGGAEDVGEINHFEWLSMWTIASLCHDLGYPLEKAGLVLNKTSEMMSDFFLRPNVSDNFTFMGIQNVINDSMLKLMSTRLYESSSSKAYAGKIQQKYYFKYAKSLENKDHGIISTVIVFKMLPFFLEVDFNLNNDSSPCYSGEDARQFYIRREILRAMSSHTCDEIFHVKIQTLPALLFICDELQEWGRKSWGDLYTGIPTSEIKLSIGSFNTKEVKITETTVKKSASDSEAMIEALAKKLIKEYRLYEKYKKTFRDGPGTAKREFNFTKTIIIKSPSSTSMKFEYKILQGNQDKFAPSDLPECEGLKKLLEESNNLDSKERDILKKLLF